MSREYFYLRAYPVRADQQDDPTAPIRFVASTEGVKADGFNLKTSDWLLGRFEKHPVILYAHDYMGQHLPLGSGKPIIDGSRLLMDVFFDSEDPFALAVRSKAKKGLMAGSVGWQQIEGGNELLEFSIVPVPLDPDALPMRQARGRRVLQDWLDEVASSGLTEDDLARADTEDRQVQDQGGEARAGAVLSSRNLEDLRKAVELINAVIDRAKKNDDQAEDENKDGGRSVDQAPILQDILSRLSILGEQS